MLTYRPALAGWRAVAAAVVVAIVSSVLVATAGAQAEQRSEVKEPIRGLMNRAELLAVPEFPGANPVAAARPLAIERVVEDFALTIAWHDIEAADGSYDFSPIDRVVTRLRARNRNRPGAAGAMRLRVLAGTESPAHVMRLGGGPVAIRPSSGSEDRVEIPRFWTAEVQEEYRELHLALGRRYDGEPLLREVVMSLCTVRFAEPMIRYMYTDQNATAYRSAGLSTASDLACHRTTFEIHAEAWPTTLSTLSLNPFQNVDAAEPRLDSAMSLSILEDCMATLGDRCVPANNSIMERRYLDGWMQPDRSASDEAMFDLYDGLRWHAGNGVHVSLQTATDARMQAGAGWYDEGTPAAGPASQGQHWAGTLEAALCVGAGSVELPREYAMSAHASAYQVAFLRLYDARLEGEPVRPGAWCPQAYYPAAEPETPGPPILRCEGRVVTVDLAQGQRPTAGDDVILGTDGDDVVNALAGDDVVCGAGGDDYVNGGPGADELFGGAGDDRLVGGEGDDMVHGRRGDDVLRSGPGADRLHGGGGVDDCKIDGDDIDQGGCESRA